MDSTVLFNSYVELAGKETLTVFECKCALMKGIGVDLEVKQIANILEIEIGWQRIGCGVSLEEFRLLFNHVSVQSKLLKPPTCYHSFDINHRGWIVEDDVFRVMTQVAPALAAKRSKDWYALADVNHMEQVSQRHYESIVSQIRIRKSIS